MTLTWTGSPANVRIVALGTGTATASAAGNTYIIHSTGTLTAGNIGQAITGTGFTHALGMSGQRVALGQSISGGTTLAGTMIKAFPVYSGVNVNSITPFWGGAATAGSTLQMGFLVTTSAAHGLAQGDLVQIAGTSAAAIGGQTGWTNAYNGYWIVYNVPSTTTFFVYHTWNTGTFNATFTANSANFTLTAVPSPRMVYGASISSAGATGPGLATNSTYVIQSGGAAPFNTSGQTYTLVSGTGITAGTGVLCTYALIPGAASAAGTVTKINNGGLSGSPTTDYITSGPAQTVTSTTLTTSVTAKGGNGGAGGRGHIRVYWY
jgi:hypothetical protein